MLKSDSRFDSTRLRHSVDVTVAEEAPCAS
jgi:hypothetical protein